MHHIATHNIGLGSYNDDFNWFNEGSFNEGPFCERVLYIRPDYPIQCQKSTIVGKVWLPFPKIWDSVYTLIKHNTGETGDILWDFP